MAKVTLHGHPSVSINLRRTARARRLSLRVSRLDGRVTLTMPLQASDREAKKFLREKESWIRENLESICEAVTPVIGGEILLHGRKVEIQAGSGRTAAFADGQILVPENPMLVAPRVGALLKTMARARLAHAADSHARALHKGYGRLTVRDTRSRWGSCSSQGNLMFSWRLIMAPPEVLNYVAAHEVAHLAEMNHSPAFWSVVARLCPGYQAPRQWLRQNGTLLHRYVFKD